MSGCPVESTACNTPALIAASAVKQGSRHRFPETRCAENERQAVGDDDRNARNPLGYHLSIRVFGYLGRFDRLHAHSMAPTRDRTIAFFMAAFPKVIAKPPSKAEG